MKFFPTVPGLIINVNNGQIVMRITLILDNTLKAGAAPTPNAYGVTALLDALKNVKALPFPANVCLLMVAHGLSDKIQMVQTPAPQNVSQHQKYPAHVQT